MTWAQILFFAPFTRRDITKPTLITKIVKNVLLPVCKAMQGVLADGGCIRCSLSHFVFTLENWC